MISANQYKLTWEHFEDINQDRRSTFESLCRTLFSRTKVSEDDILHSDPSHPGIEVAPVHSKDGSEMISFQAKYFDSAIGYDQIKSSMKTTVEKYKGLLNKVYLYCNKDITETSKSYQDIETIVSSAGIEIVLVTGQSILDEAMNFPPVLACYFGIDSLDKNWFERNLQIEIDNLGRRYNSRFNIDTEAQRELSLFLKEDEGINILNDKKENVIETLKKLRWHCDGKYKDIVNQLITSINSIPNISKNTITQALKWKDNVETENRELFDTLNKSETVIQEKLDSEKPGTEKYNKIRSELYVIDKLLMVLELLALSKAEERLISCKTVIVVGEMGTGKSQLLATSAKKTLSEGCLSLLLLGQTFISEDPIEIQIMNGLVDIDRSESFESLLGIMDEKAYENNSYSFLYIDAINESRDREVWKDGLSRLISVVEQYNNILLVVSLRSGFERIMFNDKVVTDIEEGKIALITHRGLIDESPEGIFNFLSNSGVPVSPEFYLQQEMTNPLFLTWFCQTYTGEEHGLTSLISAVINQADEEASKEAGYKESIGLLKDLLMNFIDAAEKSVVTKRIMLGLPSWELYGVTKKIAYINAIERSGVVTTYVRDGEEHYYIGYNLLEDYVRANWIIEKQKNEEEIKKYCIETLLGVDSEGTVTHFGNESVFAMVTALFSVKFGKECLEIVDDIKEDWDRERLIEEYLKTYSWRNPNLTFEEIIDFINKNHVGTNIVWKVFIESATKEKSVINADGLSKLLNCYSISKRDYLWTTEINELTEYDRVVSLAYYLEAGNKLVGQSDKSAELMLTLFAWMLSSSNRTLRDRISKAMIEVLKMRFNLCMTLLMKFKDVNDPYIIQRLYGIVFGAIMKRNKSFDSEFENLAIMVYNEIFSKDKVYPDILLRDYARLIIERFIYEYPSKEVLFEMEKVQPPYNSDSIPQVEVVDYCDDKYHEGGVWRLLYSLKFDLDVKGVGMYGDFGRYVFQSALRNFIGVDVYNIYYYALEYIFNELGYTNELFGGYDTNRADFDRHQVRRIERIGKKYEWIAMYNILARLSDTCNITGNNWNDKNGEKYSGAWNPYVRDFDPTLNGRYVVDMSMFPVFEELKELEDQFIDKDSSDEEINKWILTHTEMYDGFPERFIRRDKNGDQWISMYLYQEIKKTIPGSEEFKLSFPRGEQHIWAISAMHIADAGQNLSIDELFSSGYIRKNSGMSTTRDCYTLFSREYAWSPGFENEFAIDEEDDNCSIKACSSIVNAMWEEQYDASQDETTSYYIPAGEIIKELGLYQKDIDGAYYCEDELVAFDTKILGNEHGELLIKKNYLDLFIEKTKMNVFWDVVGEKQFFLGGHGQKWQRREGYYIYHQNAISGEIQIVPNI